MGVGGREINERGENAVENSRETLENCLLDVCFIYTHLLHST